MLIGSDVREPALQPDEPVHMLADPVLGGLHTTAIAASGARAVPIDRHAAFVAGITQIWSAAGRPMVRGFGSTPARTGLALVRCYTRRVTVPSQCVRGPMPSSRALPK